MCRGVRPAVTVETRYGLSLDGVESYCVTKAF